MIRRPPRSTLYYWSHWTKTKYIHIPTTSYSQPLFSVGRIKMLLLLWCLNFLNFLFKSSGKRYVDRRGLTIPPTTLFDDCRGLTIPQQLCSRTAGDSLYTNNFVRARTAGDSLYPNNFVRGQQGTHYTPTTLFEDKKPVLVTL